MKVSLTKTEVFSQLNLNIDVTFSPPELPSVQDD